MELLIVLNKMQWYYILQFYILTFDVPFEFNVAMQFGTFIKRKNYNLVRIRKRHLITITGLCFFLSIFSAKCSSKFDFEIQMLCYECEIIN